MAAHGNLRTWNQDIFDITWSCFCYSIMWWGIPSRGPRIHQPLTILTVIVAQSWTCSFWDLNEWKRDTNGPKKYKRNKLGHDIRTWMGILSLFVDKVHRHQFTSPQPLHSWLTVQYLFSALDAAVCPHPHTVMPPRNSESYNWFFLEKTQYPVMLSLILAMLYRKLCKLPERNNKINSPSPFLFTHTWND
jgi:hypothetical protein